MTRAENKGAATVAWAAAALAVLSLTTAVTSDGFIEADAATHFAYARYAIHSPKALVSVWARPLPTGLFAIGAAAGGRMGVRVEAILCALACGILAWRLAIEQGYRWPALAAIFTFGQPLLFLYSFSEMTELPFAAVAAAAFLAYRLRRWGLMALLAALLPLGRPEGFGFWLLAAAALMAHRQARWLPIMVMPLVVWDYGGWVVDARQGPWWQWLMSHWPYSGGSDYPRGALLHFVIELPMLVSPAALPMMWIGVGRGLRRPVLGPDHEARCQWLIAAIPLGVLIVHSLLHWMGKLSSNGELRYLLIVAPFWGLLSAAGWEWVAAKLNATRPAAWAALVVVAPGALNWVQPVLPLGMSPDWDSAQRLVAWYRSSPLQRQYPRLLFAHPGLDYYLNTRADDPVRATPCTKTTVAEDPPGYLLIWDKDFSTHNSNPEYDVTEQEALAAGWRQIAVPPNIGGNWKLFESARPEPGEQLDVTAGSGDRTAGHGQN
jgi:hypothetical protein